MPRHGSILESLESEYCLDLTPNDAHLPTFPNMVEHRKPNFPTMLAACAGVS